MTDPTAGSPTVDISQAPPSPQLVAPYTPRANVDQRTVETFPSIDVSLLTNACRTLSLLSNTSKSTGCSPVLKELMYETGLPYSVQREIWPDGSFHSTGDAIDLVVDNPQAMLRFLTSVPTLFAQVSYTDAVYVNECLYIQAGAVTSSPPVSEPGVLHIASTRARLGSNLRLAQALVTFNKNQVYIAASGTTSADTDVPVVGFW